ncbi:MAG TPA: LCP family protein [Actinomycetota bacterium]|nr:LCP family protein [Actinomycetota bacterium]
MIRTRKLTAAGVALGLLWSAASVVSGSGGKPETAHALTRPLQIRSAHGASFLPALEGKRPLFILAIGSDARPGQAPQSTRADSIHLIGMDLRRRRATILGFPRDSYIPIPGHGTDKINSALFLGGPELVVQSIENLTDIRVDFWVLTGFQGFVRFWNDVGPINVDVPRPMFDSASGANFTAGVHSFMGREALAFARDRHDVPGGDIGRSENHGRLLMEALEAFSKKVKANPAELLLWLSAGWRSVDTDISARELFDLALTVAQFKNKAVNNLVVPSSTGSAGAASVVFISSSASAIYADMRADGVSR